MSAIFSTSEIICEENKIDEQLYLSTKKYDQILAEHINNFELGKIEEELDQSQ